MLCFYLFYQWNYFLATANERSGDGDDNLPAIIGGVVGGVVLIVLIVILVVWCSRRESSTGKKNDI